jgi:hypothetical protein
MGEINVLSAPKSGRVPLNSNGASSFYILAKFRKHASMSRINPASPHFQRETQLEKTGGPAQLPLKLNFFRT